MFTPIVIFIYIKVNCIIYKASGFKKNAFGVAFVISITVLVLGLSNSTFEEFWQTQLIPFQYLLHRGATTYHVANICPVFSSKL